MLNTMSQISIIVFPRDTQFSFLNKTFSNFLCMGYLPECMAELLVTKGVQNGVVSSQNGVVGAQN